MLNQMRFLCGLYSFVLIVYPFLRSLGVPLWYFLNAMHVLFVFVFRLKTKIQFKPFYEFAAAIKGGGQNRFQIGMSMIMKDTRIWAPHDSCLIEHISSEWPFNTHFNYCALYVGKNNSAVWLMEFRSSKQIEVSSHSLKIILDNKCVLIAFQFNILQNEFGWEWTTINLHFFRFVSICIENPMRLQCAVKLQSQQNTGNFYLKRFFVINFIHIVLCHSRFLPIWSILFAIPPQNELTKSSANAPLCSPPTI